MASLVRRLILYVGTVLSHKIQFVKVATLKVLLASSSVPYWTSLICCIFCALPLILGMNFDYGDYEKSSAPLTRALTSSAFLYSIIAGIAVTVPIITEFFLDQLFISTSTNATKVYVPQNMFLALLVPLVIMLTIISPNGIPYFLPFIFHSQRIFYFHAFSYYMYLCGSPIWTFKRLIALAGLITAGEMIDCFTPFVQGIIKILYYVYIYIYLNTFLLIFRLKIIINKIFMN